jgi:uncharacterized membrane protein
VARTLHSSDMTTPRAVRVLMWVPWLVVAVALYFIGGAWFVVVPFVTTFVMLYLVRRRIRRER